MTQPAWMAALEPLGQGYRAVADRMVAATSQDDRVVAVFLTGSVGRRAADAASDLDVIVFVRDGCVDLLLAAPQEFLAATVGPTVLARRMPMGFTTITPDWERVDLTIAAESSASRVRRDAVVEVFDRTGVAGRLATGAAASVRDPNALAFLCEEFLRVLGLLHVVLQREEYLVGVEGAGLLRGHLCDLLVQESDRPAAGVKRLNQRLSGDAGIVLAGLPSVEATRQSVLDGHLSVTQVFLPRARALCRELDVAWPAELEAATRSHLATRAGVPLP